MSAGFARTVILVVVCLAQAGSFAVEAAAQTSGASKSERGLPEKTGTTDGKSERALPKQTGETATPPASAERAMPSPEK